MNANIVNATGGTPRTEAGQKRRLTSNSPTTNDGAIEAIGTATQLAEVEFTSTLTNSTSTRLVTGGNTILCFNGGLTNRDSLIASCSTSHTFGDVNNKHREPSAPEGAEFGVQGHLPDEPSGDFIPSPQPDIALPTMLRCVVDSLSNVTLEGMKHHGTFTQDRT